MGIRLNGEEMSAITEEEHKELFIAGSIIKSIEKEMLDEVSKLYLDYFMYDSNWEFWEGKQGKIRRAMIPYGKSAIEPFVEKNKDYVKYCAESH